MPSLSEVKIFRALCVCLWRTDIDGKSFPVIFFILKLLLTVREALHFARLPAWPASPRKPCVCTPQQECGCSAMFSFYMGAGDWTSVSVLCDRPFQAVFHLPSSL